MNVYQFILLILILIPKIELSINANQHIKIEGLSVIILNMMSKVFKALNETLFIN